MLVARLHPDMFDCATQLTLVADFALRATYPLIGCDGPDLPQDDPRAAIAQARAALKNLTPEDFAGADKRRIIHRAGFADLDQSAQDYLQQFALPKLWFHLSIAFAIMRSKGAAIGKAEFDRLHHYPARFSWDG